jgi:hypothetical protein
MKLLVLRPAKYAEGDGYGVFGPEGDRLAMVWRGRGASVFVAEVDCAITNHNPERPPPNLQATLDQRWRSAKFKTEIAAETLGGLTHLAVLCHGWRTGLQIGIGVHNVESVAKTIAGAVRGSSVTVVLYACSAGSGKADGDRSVADMLRDAIAVSGKNVRVFAHTESGHATYMPFKRCFEGSAGSLPLTGGYYVVNPKSPVFPRWKMALRKHPTLRFDYFDRSALEIEKALLEVESGKK